MNDRDELQARALRAARWLMLQQPPMTVINRSQGWLIKRYSGWAIEYTDAELIQFAEHEGWKDEEV